MCDTAYMKSTWCRIGLLAVALTSCDDVVDQNTASIVGGFEILNTFDAPVFRVLNKSNEVACTGVALTSRWVMTAKHCVDVGGAGDLELSKEVAQANSGVLSTGVTRVVLHPTLDVALVRSETLLPQPGSVSIRETVPVRGERLRCLGFGVTSYGSPLDISAVDRGLREATVEVNDNLTQWIQYISGSGAPVGGDSGGPCFAYKDGLPTWDLVSVHSNSNSQHIEDGSEYTGMGVNAGPLADWILENTDIWTADECKQPMPFAAPASDPTLAVRRGLGLTPQELHVLYRPENASGVVWSFKTSSAPHRFAHAQILPFQGAGSIAQTNADQLGIKRDTNKVWRIPGQEGSLLRVAHHAFGLEHQSKLLSVESGVYRWSDESTFSSSGRAYRIAGEWMLLTSSHGELEFKKMNHGSSSFPDYSLISEYEHYSDVDYYARSAQALSVADISRGLRDEEIMVGWELFVSNEDENRARSVLPELDDPNGVFLDSYPQRTTISDGNMVAVATEATLCGGNLCSNIPSHALVFENDGKLQWINEWTNQGKLDYNASDVLFANDYGQPDLAVFQGEYFVTYRRGGKPSAVMLRPLANCLGNSPGSRGDEKIEIGDVVVEDETKGGH